MPIAKFFEDEIEDIEDAAIIAGLYASVDLRRTQMTIYAQPNLGPDYWLEKKESDYVLITDDGGEVGRVDRVSEIIGLLHLAIERGSKGSTPS